jgi:hypothetical protein
MALRYHLYILDRFGCNVAGHGQHRIVIWVISAEPRVPQTVTPVDKPCRTSCNFSFLGLMRTLGVRFITKVDTHSSLARRVENDATDSTEFALHRAFTTAPESIRQLHRFRLQVAT